MLSTLVGLSMLLAVVGGIATLAGVLVARRTLFPYTTLFRSWKSVV